MITKAQRNKRIVDANLSPYERERNKLIDQAMGRADFVAGPEPDKAGGRVHEAWCNDWSVAYHREMDRLSRAKFGTGAI